MKILVFFLFLVLVTSITGNVYAAESFIDVPKSHWAYDAVQKLAHDGLIDGYSDGNFRGDKAMNRYEFATVIERMMDKYDQADASNKDLIDKLSAEFISELNKMGARVAKVEAKTNFWVAADTRFRWISDDPSPVGAKKLHGSDNFDFRQRINFFGTVNDHWSWTGRVAATWGNKFGNSDNPIGSTVYLDAFVVNGKNVLGLDNVRVGRYGLDSIGHGLIGKAVGNDGILIKKKFADKTTFKAWTGNIKSDTNQGTGLGDSGNANQLTTTDLTYTVNKNLNMGLGYYWSDIPGASTPTGTGTLNTNRGAFDQSKGYDLSVKYKLGQLTLLGDYISTTLSNATGGLPSNPKGWVVQLSNGKGIGATEAYYSSLPLVIPSQTGTDAWSVSYRSVDPGASPAGGFDTQAVAYATNPYSVYTHTTDNTKAIFLAYEKVLDKNIVLSLEYQDILIKNRGLTGLSSNNIDKTYMTKVEFFF